MDERTEPSPEKANSGKSCTGYAKTNTAQSRAREACMLTKDIFITIHYTQKVNSLLRSYFNLPVVRDFIAKVHEISETKRVALLDLGSGVGAESKVIERLHTERFRR
jgi:hypothetical protein